MHKPVSLVLLVHNEAEVVEGVIREFHTKVVSKIPGSEIVVAEDGSTDGTKDILHRLRDEIPEMRLEEGDQKRGYVAAFRAAMALPTQDLVLFCDASGKHDPDDFWPMYEQIADYDMIVGYKAHRQDPFYRIVLTKVFNFCVNCYFDVCFRDIDCPFRLIRRDAYRKVEEVPWIQSALINFEVTVRMVKMGFRVKEVPVKHFARKNGPSRGLPLKTIPRVVLGTLSNFPAIRRSLLTRPTARAGEGRAESNSTAARRVRHPI
jgi:glycosyltransferase involved in cell wall biosynthesis